MKNTDNVSANVKINVMKRQESNLTRRSLTKVREALKQERKPSKSESESDDRISTNSEASVIADLPNKGQLSHSTILLADVSISSTLQARMLGSYPLFHFLFFSYCKT